VRSLLTWVVTIAVLGAVGYFLPQFAPDLLNETQDQRATAQAECRSDNAQLQVQGCGWLIDNPGVLSDADLSVAYHNRAQGYSELDKDELAFADYEEAIRLDPDDYFSYYMRAHLHQYHGEFSAAVDDFTAAIEREAEEAALYRDRALALYYDKQFEASLPDLNKALEFDPEHAATLNSLAWTLLTLGRVDEALPISKRSLESDNEKYSGSLDTYAHIMAELGREDEAFDYFLKASRVGDTYYVRNLQEALRSKGYLASPSDGIMTTRTRQALKACISENCQPLLDVTTSD